MKYHISSYMASCSDTTGLLTEYACGGRYLAQFTCTGTKRSWEKVITNNNDRVDAFKEFWPG